MTNLQLQMVIQWLYDQCIQSWYGYVNDSTKLSIYKTIKTQFQFEKFLLGVYIEMHRIPHTHLRCSAHKLMTEEGRYHKINKNV